MKGWKWPAAAAVLILASWIGNFAYYRTGQLPESRFLRHYIEIGDRGGSFSLLYAANRSDKRKITQVIVPELPELRFYPPETHMELRHQTIYRITGYTEAPATEMQEAETQAAVSLNRPPAVSVHQVTVVYSDGASEQADIGEIRVYREQLPTQEEPAPPYEFTSGGSSSDHTGFHTIWMTRPATLLEASSAWTDMLRDAWQTEWRVLGGRGTDVAADAYPLELRQNQSIKLTYRFAFEPADPHAMDVFEMIVRLRFRESDGREWTGRMHASYSPYPTEAEMRGWVKAQREGAAG